MPESFKPELPARLTFGADVEKIHTHLISDALAASTKFSDDEKQDWTLHDSVTNEAFALYHYDVAKIREAAVPGDILGSEQVFIRSINDGSNDGSGAVKLLFVDLLQDGSPYVPEEDLDAAADGATYVVLAFPDAPPVMVKTSYIHAASYLDEGYVEKLMRVKSDMPDKIHELSDEECKVVLNSMQKFRVNMDEFESVAGMDD